MVGRKKSSTNVHADTLTSSPIFAIHPFLRWPKKPNQVDRILSGLEGTFTNGALLGRVQICKSRGGSPSGISLNLHMALRLWARSRMVCRACVSFGICKMKSIHQKNRRDFERHVCAWHYSRKLAKA